MRDDDLDAFEAIQNRPGWLHWAIANAANAIGEPSIRIRMNIGDGPKTYLKVAEEPADDEPSTYLDPDELP